LFEILETDTGFIRKPQEEGAMPRVRMLWLVFLGLTVALILMAARIPYFPGDVKVARIVQSSLSGWEVWAKAITDTGKTPWSLVLLGITALVAFLISGWRASLLSLVSFVGIQGIDPLVKAWVARPRPSPALIHVVGSAAGYSMPSTLVLIYFSTWGFLALLALTDKWPSRWMRLAILVPC
jgi:hypothetical protein